MKNILKKFGLGFIALVFVLSVGVFAKTAFAVDAAITGTAIGGVTAPTTTPGVGSDPLARTVTPTTEYTGTVTWSPDVVLGGGVYVVENATVYTATITLTATTGHTLVGVTQNQFKVAGATATNSVSSGTIIATFPATHSPELTGVTPNELTKSVTYTWDEPIQLCNDSTTPCTESAVAAAHMKIYAVDGSDHWVEPGGIDNPITSATWDDTNTILTVTYTDLLPVGRYVVDSYGYDIIDMAGNRYVSGGVSPIFTVASSVDELAALFSLPPDVAAATDRIILSHDSSGLTITLPERSTTNYLPSSGRLDYYILTLSDHADPFNYGTADGGARITVDNTTGRGYLKIVLTDKTNITSLNIHEAAMAGGATGNGEIATSGITAGVTNLNLQVLNRSTTTADTAADATALNKWSPVADGTAYVVFTLADTTPVIVPIKVVMAIAPPTAPSLTANDTANTVVGTMDTAMEYNLDSAGYVTYNASTFAALNLSGEHTLLVRVKAVTGVNSAGDVTTLTFTTNSVSHGSSGGGTTHPVIPPTTEPAPGCSAGNLFNTSTGALCINNAVPQGCSGGNLFNTSTGAVCTNNAVLQIPGCGNSATGFSTATGGSCAGNHVVTPPTPPATGNGYAFGNTLVKLGTKGEACRAWQMFFNDKAGAHLVVDGNCGPLTMSFAKTWQASVGLVADGLLGAKCRAKANTQ